MTQNVHVLNWIEEMRSLVKPDKVVWVTEGEEQIKALKAEVFSYYSVYTHQPCLF